MKPLPRHILYADDDADDVALLGEAITSLDPDVVMHMAQDGQEALDLLEGFQHGTEPCLIILDINMPRLDGKQALLRIKRNERFNDTPVIMFSTSNNAMDAAFFAQWDVDLIQKPIQANEINRIAALFLENCGKKD